MAWHRYTLVVIGLTASLCIQKGNSDGNSTGETVSEVCQTPSCLSAANVMIKKMAANPCEDFNEFACGNFMEESEIPDGKDKVSTFSVFQDKNEATLLDIITEEVKPTDPQYLINIKRFYNSCIDEDTIEAVGLAPYLTDLEFVDDWPTLNPSWSGANFDLNKVIVRYSKGYIVPIFNIGIAADFYDRNRIAIYLIEGDLQLSQKSYRLPRNDTILQAYEKYLVELAVTLDASREVAEQDVKDVVDLEIELAKNMVPFEYQTERDRYNPVQLIQLSTMYPELDIVGFLRAVFGLANITLADNETVINTVPTYMGNISQVVQGFSNRTVQNLFGFNYAKKRLRGLTQGMRKIETDFEKVYHGPKAVSPRQKYCVELTSEIYWKGIIKQYYASYFSPTAKNNVKDMIDNLKEEFYGMIEETTWMTEETKTKAMLKLAAMKQMIGYPDVGYEEADIEEQYRQYTMKADDFYGNMVHAINQSTLAYLETFGKPANTIEISMSPDDIYADYFNLLNQIVLTANSLQPPFYSETFQDYINYGAIGAIIGREITYGFDYFGSFFDGNGTQNSWWSPEDKNNFDNKTQCIIDQNVYVDEINMTLNGEKTLAGRVEDRGGLKMAFRAFKNHVNKTGQQPRLPGLDLSPDQLFFLSYAQMFCEKSNTEGLIDSVKSGYQQPNKYRLLDVLQNSEDFAKAYNCPVGSFMNPAHKCNVW